LPPQPGVVGSGPGLPAGVNDALAQQELGQPVPGRHEITAAILPRADQIPGVLLVESRDGDGRELVQPQQLGQVDGILDVGLDPITRETLQLARRHDLTPDPRRGKRPMQTEPGRSGLVDHRDRARQVGDPGPDVLVRRGPRRGLDELGGRERQTEHPD
jgi:hypothetical protein